MAKKYTSTEYDTLVYTLKKHFNTLHQDAMIQILIGDNPEQVCRLCTRILFSVAFAIGHQKIYDDDVKLVIKMADSLSKVYVDYGVLDANRRCIYRGLDAITRLLMVLRPVELAKGSGRLDVILASGSALDYGVIKKLIKSSNR